MAAAERGAEHVGEHQTGRRWCWPSRPVAWAGRVAGDDLGGVRRQLVGGQRVAGRGGALQRRGGPGAVARRAGAGDRMGGRRPPGAVGVARPLPQPRRRAAPRPRPARPCSAWPWLTSSASAEHLRAGQGAGNGHGHTGVVLGEGEVGRDAAAAGRLADASTERTAWRPGR